LDIGYFRLARNISKYSNHRVRVGCVICRKKPIGVGSNKTKTHPIHANPDTSIRGSVHAELRAIINSSSDDLSGCKAYIYRETKGGKPALARPCSYCMSILYDTGIKTVYYTVPEFPFFRKERL